MDKVYVNGRDFTGWALDTDYYLAVSALSGFMGISSNVMGCDFVHSVWPSKYYKFFSHRKEHFVAVMQGDPERLMMDGDFAIFCKDALLVAQSSSAYNKLISMGYKGTAHIPYIADTVSFHRISSKESLRKKYHIDDQVFVISNFMRDSEGSNIYTPKLIKGPDIFLEIVDLVSDMIGRECILVLLAGPRRHWIRRELARRKIPFYFYGRLSEYDDYRINTLPQSIINELYNVSDVSIVSSRSEGGPRAILESMCAGTPVISTDVGIAKDVLDDRFIYSNPEEGADIVMRGIRNQSIFDESVVFGIKNIYEKNTLDIIKSEWAKYYHSSFVRDRIGHKSFYICDLYTGLIK